MAAQCAIPSIDLLACSYKAPWFWIVLIIQIVTHQLMVIISPAQLGQYQLHVVCSASGPCLCVVLEVNVLFCFLSAAVSLFPSMGKADILQCCAIDQCFVSICGLNEEPGLRESYSIDGHGTADWSDPFYPLLPAVSGGRSRLHLIDLGSCVKVLSKSREGGSGLCLSLSALGNVILALVNGTKHIPYK